MENQKEVTLLQSLVIKAEMLKTFNRKTFEDILDVLKFSPELQTDRTEKLLGDSITEKNWINFKYNLIDELVKKIGDITGYQPNVIVCD